MKDGTKDLIAGFALLWFCGALLGYVISYADGVPLWEAGKISFPIFLGAGAFAAAAIGFFVAVRRLLGGMECP